MTSWDADLVRLVLQRRHRVLPKYDLVLLDLPFSDNSVVVGAADAFDLTKRYVGFDEFGLRLILLGSTSKCDFW